LSVELQKLSAKRSSFPPCGLLEVYIQIEDQCTIACPAAIVMSSNAAAHQSIAIAHPKAAQSNSRAFGYVEKPPKLSSSSHYVDSTRVSANPIAWVVCVQRCYDSQQI
jgi:hypothetical protein